MEGAGGAIEREFLPPYTPQLNQIENVWRDLKKRLAGRYFKSIEELKTVITGILEKMDNRLTGYGKLTAFVCEESASAPGMMCPYSPAARFLHKPGPLTAPSLMDSRIVRPF